MAQTTYQVILSTDGKHTVIATTDDATKIKAASEWASATYDRLVTRYGLKHAPKRRASAEENGEETVPECGVHHVPMVRQEGKYGPFWSCHERGEDGSFCTYRPNGR